MSYFHRVFNQKSTTAYVTGRGDSTVLLTYLMFYVNLAIRGPLMWEDLQQPSKKWFLFLHLRLFLPVYGVFVPFVDVGNGGAHDVVPDRRPDVVGMIASVHGRCMVHVGRVVRHLQRPVRHVRVVHPAAARFHVGVETVVILESKGNVSGRREGIRASEERRSVIEGEEESRYWKK